MTVARPLSLDGNDPQIQCRCVSKHVPKPLELHRHHIWPTQEGGPDTEKNQVILCPTTHANVHRLWREYEENGGRPSWDFLRNYSEYARTLVEKGRELRRRAGAEVSGAHFSQDAKENGFPETEGRVSVLG